MQKVRAVKLLAVSLIHCDHILFSFEDLNLVTMYYIYSIRRGHLISNLRAAPDKVALPGDGDHSPGGVHRYRLVTVRVAEDDVGDPE